MLSSMSIYKLLIYPIMVIATVLGAVGQVYFKRGAMGAENLIRLIFNQNTILGLLLYGGATVLYLIALKVEQLSKLSPIIALSYVWTVLLAMLWLGEQVPLVRWLGVILIVIGVVLVSL